MVEKKHPEVPGCLVRLTGDAVEDLETLFKADPQIVRWALKKMIQIERDPNAGAPLLGGLIGYRKIAVGDRDWRVVWRVVQDDAGDFRVEVAEVWAVGYRKDNEVYEEIRQRVANAGSSPKTKPVLRPAASPGCGPGVEREDGWRGLRRTGPAVGRRPDRCACCGRAPHGVRGPRTARLSRGPRVAAR